MVTYEIKRDPKVKRVEPHLKLYLEERDGVIYIMCDVGCSEDGAGWVIGSFTDDGCLNLEPDLDSSTGLSLDAEGRIKIKNEEYLKIRIAEKW